MRSLTLLLALSSTTAMADDAPAPEVDTRTHTSRAVGQAVLGGATSYLTFGGGVLVVLAARF